MIQGRQHNKGLSGPSPFCEHIFTFLPYIFIIHQDKSCSNRIYSSFYKNPAAFPAIGGSKKENSVYIYTCMYKTLLSLKAVFILALIWLGYGASAQKPNAYEVISTAQGLSQGMVFDILQDKEGFIWVATKNGLNRYDGYSFKVFANDPYNATFAQQQHHCKTF